MQNLPRTTQAPKRLKGHSIPWGPLSLWPDNQREGHKWLSLEWLPAARSIEYFCCAIKNVLLAADCLLGHDRWLILLVV